MRRNRKKPPTKTAVAGAVHPALLLLLAVCLLFTSLAPTAQVPDACDCSAIQALVDEAQAKLDQLNSDHQAAQDEYDANLQKQLATIDAEQEAVRNYNNQIGTGGSGYDPATGITVASYAGADGVVTITTTYPDGREVSRERDSRYMQQLDEEIGNQRQRRWDLEREAQKLQEQMRDLVEKIRKQALELAGLQSALATCLANCAKRAIFIDPASHIAIHVQPGVDPQQVISDYGLDGAEVIPVPEAAGGGHMVSAPKPSDEAVEQMKSDPRCKAVDKDFCREFLPGTQPVPRDKLPLQLAQADTGNAVRGDTQTPDGKPLGGTSVTVLPQDPPIDGPNPGWQADDAAPPAMGVTGDSGQYDITVSETLRRSAHIIVAGSGWATVTRTGGPVRPSGPDDVDIEEIMVTGSRRSSDDTRGSSSPASGSGDDGPVMELEEIMVTSGRVTQSGSPVRVAEGPPPPLVPPEGEEPDRVGILLRHDDWSWIPDANEILREDTSVTAKLYVPDPARPGIWIPANNVRRKLTVRFVQRSTEPGVSMNEIKPRVPVDAPDVYLHKSRRDAIDCSADPTGNGKYFGTCTTQQRRHEKTFEVRATDFGGYSLMEASCPDCVPLRALHGGLFLKGYTPPAGFPDAVEEPVPLHRMVRVPHDDNQNNIADQYEIDQGLAGIAATDDRERTPFGNGVHGDGYSAYQEYRGFRVVRGHMRSDWLRKTLLVHNDTPWPLQKFREASGLEVLEIKAEGHRERVANFNHNYAHIVDQHCLLFKVEDPGDGWAGMSYGLGPPKNVRKVVIEPDYRSDAFHTVAHELGHATGLRHHGDKDKSPVEVHRDSNILSSFVHSYVHPEPYLCEVFLPATFDLGQKGDQTSGVEQCIMRYTNWGDIYEQADGALHCHVNRRPREFFCESRTGTGQNANGAVSGDATRGDCQSQFVVNDNS